MSKMKKSVWSVILKVVIAVASAIIGALGGSAMSWWRRCKTCRM